MGIAVNETGAGSGFVRWITLKCEKIKSEKSFGLWRLHLMKSASVIWNTGVKAEENGIEGEMTEREWRIGCAAVDMASPFWFLASA